MTISNIDDMRYQEVWVTIKDQLFSKIRLLYSWRFSRYSAPIHWLVHGHMTSNNETVSRQMP